MRNLRKNDVHQVHVSRVMKNSPYNLTGFIPKIVHEDRECVIGMPEVQAMINGTCGRRLIAIVHTENETDYLLYEIEKGKKNNHLKN